MTRKLLGRDSASNSDAAQQVSAHTGRLHVHLAPDGLRPLGLSLHPADLDLAAAAAAAGRSGGGTPSAAAVERAVRRVPELRGAGVVQAACRFLRAYRYEGGREVGRDRETTETERQKDEQTDGRTEGRCGRRVRQAKGKSRSMGGWIPRGSNKSLSLSS